MSQPIVDVMSTPPVCLPGSATVRQVAELMRDEGIGDVMVVDGERISGFVTDRDIVVRALAEGLDPDECRVADICSRHLVTLDASDTVKHAIELMRQHAVRRLPVVDHGQPAGIVTIGDLAIERADHSVLAEISAAADNN
jgi:CBS domain-containing protein